MRAQAVLASHMGVVRLMDMMNEREAIRNEALLLLNRLTRDSVDIQKIAAFEGAFERLFNIVRCTATPVPTADLLCSGLSSQTHGLSVAQADERCDKTL